MDALNLSVPNFREKQLDWLDIHFPYNFKVSAHEGKLLGSYTDISRFGGPKGWPFPHEFCMLSLVLCAFLLSEAPLLSAMWLLIAVGWLSLANLPVNLDPNLNGSTFKPCLLNCLISLVSQRLNSYPWHCKKIYLLQNFYQRLSQASLDDVTLVQKERAVRLITTPPSLPSDRHKSGMWAKAVEFCDTPPFWLSHDRINNSSNKSPPPKG